MSVQNVSQDGGNVLTRHVAMYFYTESHKQAQKRVESVSLCRLVIRSNQCKLMIDINLAKEKDGKLHAP